MAAPSSIESLRSQLNRAGELAGKKDLTPGVVVSWQTAVTVLLERAYGSDSPQRTGFPALPPRSEIVNPREEIQKRARELERILDGVKAGRSKKIFIGHGHSRLWLELQKFISTRLNLPCDEFNRVSTAGHSTVARISTMLDEAAFAFLVMTGEDQDPQGEFHPRENVIHEAGLFQGRLGFPRAIILIEQGCTEFSNIVGLTTIRFPMGDIAARFEDVRRVLEREGISLPPREGTGVG